MAKCKALTGSVVKGLIYYYTYIASVFVCHVNSNNITYLLTYLLTTHSTKTGSANASRNLHVSCSSYLMQSSVSVNCDSVMSTVNSNLLRIIVICDRRL